MTTFSHICVLSALAVSLTHAQQFTKALAKVEPATVMIRTLNSENLQGLGTGFFVSSDGLLLTNAHVIKGATSAVVQLANGSVTSVISIKAVYPDADLAFVQTGLKKSDPVVLELDKTTERGSAIAVLGNPKGLEFSFSTGVVSSFRKIEAVEYLQFTAPISKGSSGSPVFDPDGNVLGIATMYKQDGQNLNFAVSSKTIAALMNQADQQPQSKWISYDPFRDARAPSQTEMTLEASGDHEELEKLHQKVYDEILAIYSDDKEFIENLRRSQRAWIAFREAHVRAIWPAIETNHPPLGSAERMSIPTELETLTRQRIQQLLTWRNGIEEGDVGSGTRMTPEEVKNRDRLIKIKKN